MTVAPVAARQEAPFLPFPEPSTPSCETVEVGGRPIAVTSVFDTYWRFAAARQHIYEARLAGRPGPWTADPILRQHRFTNCYRAADRVSPAVAGGH
jgi:hypothetical protein